jgi:hypothetical protein
MPPKPLKLASLDLDLENPRITLASDQRDAMQKIITEQGVKVINLAENIAARGLNPMNRFLVMSSSTGKFIVLEGNRRLVAMKLLQKPELIDDMEMSEALRKRLHKAASGFDITKLEPLPCFQVTDRAEGNEWLRQRHIGADQGRGVVDWSAIASSRFRGRDPALQALDFVLQYADLTEEQGEMIAARFPLTTLERLVSTPSVRSAIGLEIDKGKLLTELPAKEVLKPLRRIVLDLAEKKINVTKLKSKGQQEDYVSNLKASDLPNLGKKTGKPLPVEGIKEADFERNDTPVRRRSHSPKRAARLAIVPKGCKLNVTVPKIDGIYEELRTLQLSKHVHAIGVLLRVFLEMSVDDYMARHHLPTTFIEPKSKRKRDKNLKTKVKDAVAHMVANGAVQKDLKGVTSAMTDANHPFAIDTLHAYIHNRFFTPVDRHLVTAWDNAEPFFGIIWP